MKTASRNSTHRSCAALLTFAALALPGLATAACSPDWGSYTFPLPARAVVVANSAAIGETIGPWISTGEQGYIFCGPSGGILQENFHIGVLPETGTYQEGGRTYGIFDTGIAGIGMVVRARADPDYGSNPVAAIREGVRVRAGAVDNKRNFGLISIRFVKTGATTPGHYTFTERHVLDMQHYQRGDKFRQAHHLSSMALEVVHRPLCHVASKTVPMGLTAVARLPSVSTYGSTRRFSVEMNCETSAGRVRYFVEPTGGTTIFDRSRGIANVEGGANGIGIQLLGIDGNPINLDSAYWFGDSAADGIRSEDFGARYFRTAVKNEDVSPGDANATVRFRVDYP